ncbi:GtrA family protein [Pantoea sp. BIGb0393]|uniref:Bactoprenol-linked glucose translocase n=1 Tax=Pantoea nemavictus TaxID=2726955 RepID=A0ABU8PY45_9GAMM|nr:MULTISPECIES: GtrA family protein [Pantoea]EJL84546.1 putative membrane protein [Pantoea sp. GM01]KNC15769.1 translocase [Pantoea sp. RIT-PI-b]MBA0037994.1 GtrA family protein [Pantoea nemavictus]
MLKIFSRFFSVGIINTLIHWVVFALIYSQHVSQWLANFIAFSVAVTFSFFANAKWTFKTQITPFRYVMFVAFMGAMAAGIGLLADHTHINPFITLVTFSAISLIFGFIYSNFIVFRVNK